MGRVSGKVHVCRLCPCNGDSFARCSSSNMSRRCGQNGKMAAGVRSRINDGGSIAIAVRPTGNSFVNFIGRGIARFEVGIASLPGGIATRIKGGGIGLAGTTSGSRFTGNRGIFFCSRTPSLGQFTAGKDRFRGAIVAGGPRLLIGLNTASVATGAAALHVRKFHFIPRSHCQVASKALTTPITQIATSGARTCALGPA